MSLPGEAQVRRRIAFCLAGRREGMLGGSNMIGCAYRQAMFLTRNANFDVKAKLASGGWFPGGPPGALVKPILRATVF